MLMQIVTDLKKIQEDVNFLQGQRDKKENGNRHGRFRI